MHKTTIFTLALLMSLLLSIRSNSQWVLTSGPGSGASFGVNGVNLYAGAWNSHVFTSTNNGTNWTDTYNGMPTSFNIIYAIMTKGTNIFAGTQLSGVYMSTNNGTNWYAANSGLTTVGVYSFAVIGMNLFAATNGLGVYLSTNDGVNWTTVNFGLTPTYVYALAVKGTNLFAGTDAGVYLSTNIGATWTIKSTGLNAQVRSLIAVDSNLFAGTIAGGGVFLSTNNGENWVAANNGISSYNILSLAGNSTHLFAATPTGGVFHSTNKGTNWTSINEGLTGLYTDAVTISGNDIFIGTAGVGGTTPGVWRRSLSELTSVQNISKLLPEKYSLSQNYPNPFNPVTKISFDIVKSGFVTLRVYDILGKEVKTLVNEMKQPGKYDFDFSASELSSGVYFYKMETVDFVEVKRMLLIK